MSFQSYDIEYGRHSRIPECCINFYIKDFPRIFNSQELEEYDKQLSKSEQQLKKPYCYRPCLDCISKNNWQDIHMCSGPCKNLHKELQKKYSIDHRDRW